MFVMPLFLIYHVNVVLQMVAVLRYYRNISTLGQTLLLEGHILTMYLLGQMSQ